MNDYTAEELYNLNRHGLSFQKIADRYGISRGKVAGIIRRYKPTDEGESTEFEQGDDFINVVCASHRIMSKDDIIKQFNVDLDIWEVERYRVKTSEGYRKDRKVRWEVKDGIVVNGDVDDTGKMLVVPLYHIEVRLVKKKRLFEAKTALEQLKEDAKNYAPKYPAIKYNSLSDGCLYEIDMQDIHFGRLTWEEESGESYDVKLAQLAVESTLTKLLAYSSKYEISKILFPMGNDFFNVDNKDNTTTRGTKQQEDTRWQKTFRLGRKLCVQMIDMCAQIAPVDVLMISGNHDEQRSFFLGETLECWYHNCDYVNIDNSARKQKYYHFGKNLIGFAHGADEPLTRLPLMMALDVPDLWAQSKYREWHTGDKHHKKDLIPVADESRGMVVRILRALASEDAWTFNSGFRSIRASEAFLWHPNDGLLAQLTATPEIECRTAFG